MTNSDPPAAPEFLVEPFGDVVKVTLNRPQTMNAIPSLMALELTQRLNGLAAEGARAVIITGAGRGFCSGASLAPSTTGPVDQQEQFDVYYNPLARALSDLPIPIVTALNGAAVGAGVALALAGDIVVAARSAYLLLSFARIGLVPDMGATWLVARAAGRARTLQMALLAEKMPAEEALAAGLITEVVDDAALMGRAEQLATRLAAMPTRTLGVIRAQVRAALETPFDDMLGVERDNQILCGKTADFREGITAFQEKRPPVFTGR
jgi:2-(1,2-epoxy-1,2-dihydrophenyl)acetyl-CoA isomerase